MSPAAMKRQIVTDGGGTRHLISQHPEALLLSLKHLAHWLLEVKSKEVRGWDRLALLDSDSRQLPQLGAGRTAQANGHYLDP